MHLFQRSQHGRGRAIPQAERLVRLLGCFILVTLLSVTKRSMAADDWKLHWKTVEAPHVRVHYAEGLGHIAQRVAHIAETARVRIEGSLALTPPARTEIVLTDDTDSANGSATPLPYNTIRLFVTAPDDMSALGDYDDWYGELVTHEYTHIVHTDTMSGAPAVLNAILGKTMVPNQIQPRFILEGLAVVMESEHTTAGRIRASMFDMFLRADVADDRWLRLDQVTGDPVRWPGGSIRYIYGSRFLRFIADIYGEATFGAVAADYGSNLIPFGVSRSIRRATGRTYSQLYAGFTSHARTQYQAQIAEVRASGIVEGERITHRGGSVSYPRFGTDGDTLQFGRQDAQSRNGIYRCKLSTGCNHSELIARTNAEGPFSLDGSGRLWFIATPPHRNLYAFDDLFRLDAGTVAPDGDEPSRRQITQGRRVLSVDASPDGKTLAVVTNSRGTTTLWLVSVNPEGKLGTWERVLPEVAFEQVFTPRFSPDGRKIAMSRWTTGGYRDIYIWDLEERTLERVTRDRALDLQPSWSPDGSKLYFSSDRTGIFNIYSWATGGSGLHQMTNVRTGAFAPVVDPKEQTLVYVGYTSFGYDLFKLRLASVLPRDPAPSRLDRAPPSALILGPDHPVSEYSPWSTLAPRSYAIEYKPGSFGGNALTVSAHGGDVVGHHAIDAAIIADPHAEAPAAAVSYSYGRLPVDLSMRVSHSLQPRSSLVVGGKNRDYTERSVALSSAVSYKLRGEFSSQGVTASYSAAHNWEDFDFPRDADPYDPVPRIPRDSTLGIVRFSYSFAHTEDTRDSPGRARGWALALSSTLANEATASDQTLYGTEAQLRAYLPLGYLPGHTLAWRLAGGITAGSYARQGYYYVGGYDLENTTLGDSIISGETNGAYPIRGYPAGVYRGPTFLQQTLEYRFPIGTPDRGLSTVPLFLQRIDGIGFVDYGGAFDELDLENSALFQDGKILYCPSLHAAVGGEIWIQTVLFYGMSVQWRIGYAHGFSAEAFSPGQAYFVAASTF